LCCSLCEVLFAFDFGFCFGSTLLFVFISFGFGFDFTFGFGFGIGFSFGLLSSLSFCLCCCFSCVIIFVLFSIRLLNRNGATVPPIRSHGKGSIINRMGVILILDK
jgi:hypothetical protein